MKLRCGDQCPNLAGGWLVRADVREDRVVLLVDGVRRFGLRFAVEVTFADVSTVEGYRERLASVPPKLTGGQDVRLMQSHPGRTVLDLYRVTGPGDADQTRFTITHGAVTASFRLNAEQSARAWLGFYPLRRDHLRRG